MFGIKNVFLTASPLLIDEISKLYEELKNHLKMELDIKNTNLNVNMIKHIAKFDLNFIRKNEK